MQTASGIAYDVRSAAAPPVLLIHAGVADRRMWDPQWAALPSAIRLDLRGFGFSVQPPAGPLDHVFDVLEVLDQAGVEGCHVVGSSFGAGVAAELALTRPDRVRSLLLAPPGGSLLADLTPDLQAFFDAERAALAADDLDAAVEANIATWVIGPGRAAEKVSPDVLAAVRQMQRRAFEIAQEWDEATFEPPALDRLADLVPPVLVLVGAHDLDTTHDAAARVVAGAPRAKRVDWPDVAHLPSMEQPARFLSLMDEWHAGL